MTSKVRTVRGRGDDGLTFTELLAAIMILGVCVVFILGGTTLLPIASNTHRQDSQADLILRNWAEAIKAKGFVSGPELTSLCNPDDTNPYAIGKLGSFLPAALPIAGFTIKPPDVKTWNGVDGQAFVGCNTDPVSARFARVGLMLASTNTAHPVSQSLEVVVAQL